MEMSSLRMQKVCMALVMLMLVIVCCKPHNTEAGRVIFYGPQRVYTGQILSTHAKKEPCPKCQMRDHRGRCRRIITFNPEEKC
uniref:Putative secreted protein n=2 Tax=Haematobia irritans TaxID=7368 RepID=A0A1L8EJ92_HAEIR